MSKDIKSTTTLGQLIQRHSRIPPVFAGVGMYAGKEALIAGIVIRDYPLIERIRKVSAERGSDLGIKCLVEIDNIKDATASVIFTTDSRRSKFDVPIHDLFPIDGIVYPRFVKSRLYKDHIVYMRIKDSLTTNRQIPLEILACEVEKEIIEKISSETSMLHRSISAIKETNTKNKNLVKVVEDSLEVVKKTLFHTSELNSVFVDAIEKAKEGKTTSTKKLLEALGSLVEDVENHIYAADDLARNLLSSGDIRIETDKNHRLLSVLSSTQFVEREILGALCDQNSRAVNERIIGRKVLYKPLQQKCTVLGVLGNGEMIVQFDSAVREGHSLDGLKPTGTCLNTDEENLEIKRETPALKIEIGFCDTKETE